MTWHSQQELRLWLKLNVSTLLTRVRFTIALLCPFTSCALLCPLSTYAPPMLPSYTSYTPRLHLMPSISMHFMPPMPPMAPSYTHTMPHPIPLLYPPLLPVYVPMPPHVAIYVPLYAPASAPFYAPYGPWCYLLCPYIPFYAPMPFRAPQNPLCVQKAYMQRRFGCGTAIIGWLVGSLSQSEWGIGGP